MQIKVFFISDLSRRKFLVFFCNIYDFVGPWCVFDHFFSTIEFRPCFSGILRFSYNWETRLDKHIKLSVDIGVKKISLALDEKKTLKKIKTIENNHNIF